MAKKEDPRTVVLTATARGSMATTRWKIYQSLVRLQGQLHFFLSAIFRSDTSPLPRTSPRRTAAFLSRSAFCACKAFIAPGGSWDFVGFNATTLSTASALSNSPARNATLLNRSYGHLPGRVTSIGNVAIAAKLSASGQLWIGTSTRIGIEPALTLQLLSSGCGGRHDEPHHQRRCRRTPSCIT